MKSLNRMILLVAAAVSVLLVFGIYLLFSGFGDRMMQKAAFSQSAVVAKLTFSSMFQLMNQGWTRDQVIAFTDSAVDSLGESPMRIEFHRSELVSRQYGEVPQAAMNDDLAKVMASGRPREVAGDKGGRYFYPLIADERCLSCHAGIKKGDVLGAITVEASFDRFIDDTRKLLMMILLLMTPAPFLAAWLVTLYIDSRVNRFTGDLDAVLDEAGKTGQPPDFTRIRPAWHELDDILERMKRLVGPR